MPHINLNRPAQTGEARTVCSGARGAATKCWGGMKCERGMRPNKYINYCWRIEKGTNSVDRICPFVRRLRDSNPRYSYPYTNFPGLLVRPL